MRLPKQMGFFASLFFLLSAISVQAQNRVKIWMGDNWQFQRGDTMAGAWETVQIPHTARLENLVVVKQFQGTCYYKKRFSLPRDPALLHALYFEAVMMETEVWVNGQKQVHHYGGYLPFTVWLPSFNRTRDEVEVLLKVSNTDNPDIPPGKPLKDLDFNYYGGIYRPVYLIQTGKTFITDPVQANKPASGGLYVQFNRFSKEEAAGTLRVHVQRASDLDIPKSVVFNRPISIRGKLESPSGKTFPFRTAAFLLKEGLDTSVDIPLRVSNPEYWHPDQPNLYAVDVQVMQDGAMLDELRITTGIRHAELKDDGFYLNGNKIWLTGTNRHQEYPYVGYAIPDEAQYRDAVQIKNAGFNIVRLSHYPQSEAFLRACDELGLIVMNCIPGWQFFGGPVFQDRSIQDIRDMIRRDRNHPSVIFWENSLNETEMTETYIRRAAEAYHEELPFGNAVSAGWMDHPAYDIYIPARQHGKAPDYWNFYQKGNRKIFMAEYGDWEYYAQNAGFKQTEFANLKEEERTSRQLRAFGEKRLLQQAFNFQEASNSNRKGFHTIGEANWLMYDYNRGYSPDLESSGICDIFRIPKWSWYFYQSQRNPSTVLKKPLQSGPMVHIASYWNQASSKTVRIFSNCDEVALYLNGKLIERKKPSLDSFNHRLPHPPFVFQLPSVVPGTLKAVGYINGKEAALHELTSAGKASSVHLDMNLQGIPISRHRKDLIFVYASILDQNGNLVSDATDPVQFSIRGSGASITGPSRVNAEAGIATVLISIEDLRQPVEIEAASGELRKDTLHITNTK